MKPAATAIIEELWSLKWVVLWKTDGKPPSPPSSQSDVSHIFPKNRPNWAWHRRLSDGTAENDFAPTQGRCSALQNLDGTFEGWEMGTSQGNHEEIVGNSWDSMWITKQHESIIVDPFWKEELYGMFQPYGRYQLATSGGELIRQTMLDPFCSRSVQKEMFRDSPAGQIAMFD